MKPAMIKNWATWFIGLPHKLAVSLALLLSSASPSVAEYQFLTPLAEDQIKQRICELSSDKNLTSGEITEEAKYLVRINRTDPPPYKPDEFTASLRELTTTVLAQGLIAEIVRDGCKQ